MRLKTLTLENFRGTKQATYRFDGKSATVYGMNGAGKTTIYDAITWLLFGKSSTGFPGFSPKVKDGEGKHIHGLENSVEAVFDQDGKELTLKKVLKENWSKVNGKIDETKKTNTTVCFIDGVDTPVTKFGLYIESLIPPDRVKILSNPFYFSSEGDVKGNGGLHWTARREILFSLCNELTMEDILAENPELEELPTILGNHTIDQCQTISKAEEKKIREEREKLPERIDEATKAIPDLAGLTLSGLDSDLKEAEEEKAGLQTALAKMSDSEAAAKVRKQIADIEAQYAEKKGSYLQELNTANQGIYAEIKNTDKLLNDLARSSADSVRKEADERTAAERMAKRRAELQNKYNELKASVWQGDTTCYACGQSLPESRIEEAKKKFETDRKSKQKAIINEVETTCSKEMQAQAEQKAEEFASQSQIHEAKIKELEEKRESLREHTKSGNGGFDCTDIAVELQSKLAELRQQTSESDTAMSAAKRRINEQIAEITERINAIITDKGKFAVKATQEARIEKLKQREKELSEQFDTVQHKIMLCESFIRTKSDLISRRICAKFKTVQFAFFEEQMNGGENQCCNVLVPSEKTGALVTWNEANTAAKYNAGIEIIDTLSKAWGMELPLFLDNRDNVSDIIESYIQVISLIVDRTEPNVKIVLKEEDKRNVA